MNKMPIVKEKDIIYLGQTKMLVTRVYSEAEKDFNGDIQIVYHKGYGSKATKCDLIWSGNDWKTKGESYEGTYVNLTDFPELLK